MQYLCEYAPINLIGNHEAMYLATKPKGKKRLKPDELGDLRPPLELCYRQLGADDAEWISQLPLVVPVSEMELVHGSLHEPPTFGLICAFLLRPRQCPAVNAQQCGFRMWKM